jgi:hypothetical protein
LRRRSQSFNGKYLDVLLELYKIYDAHRDAILWLLEDLDAENYQDYLQKYPGSSSEKRKFVAVCGFFELSGVLLKNKMVAADLYFDIFNPTPFWHKARPIVEGMREKRPFIYENFQMLSESRALWTKKRRKRSNKGYAIG